jgi:predicted membrane-bound dolichyl-phosphate-mannose-protein mannosyltransferase
LFSHKILRWLSPFLIVAAAALGAMLADRPIYFAFECGLVLAALLALLGWLAERRGITLPLASTAYSFALANAGFAMGVVKAVLGHRIVSYRGAVDRPQRGDASQGPG